MKVDALFLKLQRVLVAGRPIVESGSCPLRR